MAADPTSSAAVIKEVVDQVKSRGHFDTFRRECLSDIEEQAVYKMLQRRVAEYMDRFLAKQRWYPQMNKIQMREKLREDLMKMHFVQSGVQNIVNHIVNSHKMQKQLYPVVETLIYEHFGLDPPTRTSTAPQTEQKNVDSQKISTLEKKKIEEENKQFGSVKTNADSSNSDTPVQDELSTSISKENNSKLEQIDVDEGAELFVQCATTTVVAQRNSSADDVEIVWDISSQPVKLEDQQEQEQKLHLEPVDSPATSVDMSIESSDD